MPQIALTEYASLARFAEEGLCLCQTKDAQYGATVFPKPESEQIGNRELKHHLDR